jgi:hypothetical protein
MQLQALEREPKEGERPRQRKVITSNLEVEGKNDKDKPSFFCLDNLLY